jgi:hypothetical protein
MKVMSEMQSCGRAETEERLSMELEKVVRDVADCLANIDVSGVPFKHFQPGIGPYGEPQLVRAVAQRLRDLPDYGAQTRTKRTPDLLIPGKWALEFKIARPFGDNGREAENWSVNLLHPYEGNVSVIGDCLKLRQLDGPERKAAIVVGYEHTPPKIALTTLLDAFEVVATNVARIRIGPRIQVIRTGLCHPVHQQLIVAAWEILG